MIRIISGSAGGRRIKTPPGRDTRPTTDMTREALFNVLGPDIYNARFLDLFSGSGAIGIEAVSRGAGSSVMVEKDPKAVSVIRENIDACGFRDRCRVIRGDVMSALRAFRDGNAEFDFIYMDPPYGQGDEDRANAVYAEVLEFLSGSCVIARGGIIIAEHGFPLEDAYGSLMAVKSRRYGISRLTFFKRGE